MPNSSKRVLIITYYWPPSGGGGVQRWLKFVKYLPELGWTPVVYTPENPEYPAIDESLERDIPEEAIILKTPIKEPYSFYKRFVGKSKDEAINTGFLTESEAPRKREVISRWVRGNLFIPDARKFWIKPSIRFLSDYLEKNPVDLIISSGPPHSMHLIALGLRKKFDIPWLSDFRDPWTQIDFYKELRLTESSDRKHHRLEKEVLETSDGVVVVSPTMLESFSELASMKSIEDIPNGYDEEDFQLTEVHTELDSEFTISHIGSFSPTRNPSSLWKVLKDICDENEAFNKALKIKLVGRIDISVRKELEASGLMTHVQFIDYMPHDKVIDLERRSQLLLLVVNRTENAKMILTGKVFEYLFSKRPILAIGPTDGDLAHLVLKTNSGETVDYDDTDRLKASILSSFNLYQQGKLQTQAQGVEAYSRRNLTTRLSEVMNNIISA